MKKKISKSHLKYQADILRQLGSNNIHYEDILMQYVDNPRRFQLKFTQMRRTLFDDLERRGK